MNVKLVDHMGSDDAVILAARRCWRSEDKRSTTADRNLIRHLIRKEHKTPFEFLCFVFDIKAPIFVARQIMRHRHVGICEESLRYCDAKPEFWVPDDLDSDQQDAWMQYNLRAFEAYQEYCTVLPAEQARAVLPLGLYTSFYWTVNGSSLMNFLRLRLDPHTQQETRKYAGQILTLVEETAPTVFGEWRSHYGY